MWGLLDTCGRIGQRWDTTPAPDEFAYPGAPPSSSPHPSAPDAAMASAWPPPPAAQLAPSLLSWPIAPRLRATPAQRPSRPSSLPTPPGQRRDYCYFVAMLTNCLATLSDYWVADWKDVKIAVYWRAVTVAFGVAISGVCTVAVFPVYATDQA